LFAVVANLSNQRGYCFASNSYLAKVTGWHHKTVSGFVSELIKAGYLKRFDEVTSTGLERRLFVTEGASVPHRETTEGVPSNDGGGVAKPRRGVSSNDGGGRSQMTAQNNIRLKVKDNYIPAGANKERNDGTSPSKTSPQKKEKIKTIGTGKHFILITPPEPGSLKVRIHGDAGLREFFEMNNSILRDPEQAGKFMYSNAGKPYNNFQHLFNDYKNFCLKQLG